MEPQTKTLIDLDAHPDASENSFNRSWTGNALRLIRTESARSGTTPLLRFPVFAESGIDVFLKDESLHPTGSLKHRLARSLFVHALCNGDIGPNTPVIEASSGSTAVSEAYFSQLIGVPFFAVVPRATSKEKVELIEQFGGQCHQADDPLRVVSEAKQLADEIGGHFMDQFTFASQTTNWRADNVADEIFHQIRSEASPVPRWVVVGAGTGGTSTTIARYLRYKGIDSRLAVVDPEGSAFYDAWRLQDRSVTTSTSSRIEGIGRAKVEPSFFPQLVDEMIQVPDAASIATMRWVSARLGRMVGPSTGTNMWGVLKLAQKMHESSEIGSVVSLICDTGIRYASTYYNDSWLQDQGIDILPFTAALESFTTTGQLIVD